jgi:hypothetical protein|tara:strand:+ start:2780 stop:2905 length:126 start_codon:yes stop_codon:yes gene_type:complete
MAQFQLADRLHLPLQTIKDMTLEEFYQWIAFYSLESKRMKK